MQIVTSKTPRTNSMEILKEELIDVVTAKVLILGLCFFLSSKNAFTCSKYLNFDI